MAASAMAGQQMEMMGSRVKAQSRGQSVTARNRELFETQRRARRGPTPEVFFTKHIDNSRIVKDAFRDGVRAMHFRLLTKKPVTATEEESERNPRARSAKLRAAERTDVGRQTSDLGL